MKVIFRNFIVTLRRFRLASILNILGLSIAFASYMIIMMQVQYESTFDTAYQKTGHIYRVESTLIPTEESSSSGEVFTAFLARPLIEMLMPAIPQIESYAMRFYATQDTYINYESADGEKQGMMMPFYKVCGNFPQLFNMEITEGVATSLSEPGKVLLPESLARKMFGEASAINKQILVRSDNTSYTVGGVYKDFPDNTSFVNDVKIGFGDEHINDWTDWTFQLFVVLVPGASPERVSEQLTTLFRQTEISNHMGTNSSFRLTPLEDVYYQQDTHLDIAPKGNRTMTYILRFIALLIVMIAAINFLNFSTALTPARIKSINIQKILGNPTGLLRVTLICEAIGICVLSFFFALCGVLILNFTGLLSGLINSTPIFSNSTIILHTCILALLTGIISGLYPAFYMTSFRPALALKGMSGISPGKQTLRILLTGFQFIISTTLIIAAIFIRLQNNHLYHMENIMNNKQIATVQLDKEILTAHGEVLVEKLTSHSQVTGVALSEWPIGFQDFYPYTYVKSAEGEDIRYFYLPVSWNFTGLTDLPVISGRNFTKTDALASEERVIFNELGARQFNIKPGDRLSNGSLVVGIVKDFHFMNMRKQIEPLALTAKDISNTFLPVLYIHSTGHAEAITDHIRTTLAEVDPLYPVQINFYDHLFEQTYQAENKTSSQIILFSLLAVIISLAGVFGLVTFDTQYRQKEICMRKVMGASVKEILLLFNKKFIRMTVICFLIASPTGWLVVTKWLQSFPYRIPLYSWVFLLAFLLILLITTLTVTVQSWNTANSDPAQSLKSE